MLKLFFVLCLAVGSGLGDVGPSRVAVPFEDVFIASEHQPHKTNLVTKGQKSIYEIGDVHTLTKKHHVVHPVPAFISSRCPTASGLYAVEGYCNRYIHCREGVDAEVECPGNTVFDQKVSTCVHPDQAEREDCTGDQVHNFECPKYVPGKFLKFRFGDHDRFAHPSDCSKFFSCLTNGQPRLATCPPPTVFDEVSGFCKHYKEVKGCNEFYNHYVEPVKVASVEKPLFTPFARVEPPKPLFKPLIRGEAPKPNFLSGRQNFFHFQQRRF